MRLWTYSELKSKIEKDLDLEDEIFITPEELLGYFNEAIDEAEAVIHDLYEDYYLTKAFIPLVSGTQVYAFPADIYAMKLRAFTYSNGTQKYEIKKWKDSLANIMHVGDSEDYRYIPINTTASGYQLMLLPTSRETSSTNATLWYIRNATALVDDTDVCDLPELAINFVLQFVKQRCYEKEGHPTTLKAITDTENLKKSMTESLANMVDDESEELRKDVSFYEEFDSDLIF
jgi:hypothetical protein